ncbi:hypothetical protein BV378_14100 [Nostoc sp. RF31YmG]|nr:hypothetical protein BV378_14100 [Nostoc sp. RF31YmG]
MGDCQVRSLHKVQRPADTATALEKINPLVGRQAQIGLVSVVVDGRADEYGELARIQSIGKQGHASGHLDHLARLGVDAKDQRFLRDLFRAQALGLAFDPQSKLCAGSAPLPTGRDLPQVVGARATGSCECCTALHIGDVGAEVHGRLSSHALDVMSSSTLDHPRLAGR